MIKAQPYNFPYDGALNPDTTALLVIDLQVDFLSHHGYFAKMGYDPSPLRAIIPNVNKVIIAARQAGCMIVHTRQGYRGDLADMSPYEKWRRKRSGLEATNILLRSSPGFATVEEIDFASTDVIVDKTCNGSFTYTDLEHILRSQGISHLLFTGCTTDVCVHTTLREACDRNFQCLTIEDACASGEQWAHVAAIKMILIEDGVFGTVSNTENVVAGLVEPGTESSC